MTGRMILAATVMGFALVAGAVAAPQARKSAPAAAAPDAQAQQLIRNCNAHKFETVVHEVVDGQPQQSKVKLCGKERQTDAEWIGTLKDAVAKLNANKAMDAAVRDQIIAALNGEIARLQSPRAVALVPPPTTGKTPTLDGLSPLPPLPQPKQANTGLLPPPRQVTRAAPQDEYASLPPLPTAPPAPTHVLAGAGTSIALLPRPRMSFSCYTPGETPEGPCTGFTRDTLITVHAGEDLPAGTSLRFVRDGDPRADVSLAQLKKGRSVQLTVPTDVCLHAVGGRLELRIVRSGQEVGTDGPYNLNC